MRHHPCRVFLFPCLCPNFISSSFLSLPIPPSKTGNSCKQTYPSIRGRTIFRAKDRLALTKGIMSAFFDMGVLQARGIVDAMCALHDANRGEAITTEVDKFL